MATKIEVSPCGDSALRVTVVGTDTDGVWKAVHRLAGWLNRGAIQPTVSAVPTYDAVLVEFDPYHTTAEAITSHIAIRFADSQLHTAMSLCTPEVQPLSEAATLVADLLRTLIRDQPGPAGRREPSVAANGVHP
ncbi:MULTISPECIES: carboxyltransferase domain-containing protein [Streptomyces]|uniref:carboxyltransferase domain-containing protein n=1 Tax=Streptomyces lycopersici TaxID=2974589 RepID=UPI0021D25536|nr:carboxyltransferase domain-containing protein [Streptomyces sp. NEAU-383]